MNPAEIRELVVKIIEEQQSVNLIIEQSKF